MQVACLAACLLERFKPRLRFEDIFYEDDVNMGMLPGSGLKSWLLSTPVCLQMSTDVYVTSRE